MNAEMLTLVVGAYVIVNAYLGWLGYRRTRDAADFMLGGRQIHPVLMALAYGSTFISTSAIVGFGGQAARLGLGILWLTFLNIAIGVWLAFVVYGRATRDVGEQLDAHTFPELLGRRFRSRFIQGFAGFTIATLMPLYAAAVLIGGARFVEVQLGMDFKWALFVFAVVVVSYVVVGGLKGVVYTDAFQGTLMMVGMVILLGVGYAATGGFGAHQALTDLAPQVPASLAAQGHRGWTCMPALGSPIWWQLVSSLILGVGIGVLAQPQLAVRFMTVRSSRELYRGLLPGGVFILIMAGASYVVGALTNVYFWQREGRIALAVVTDPATGVANVDKIIPTFIRQAMPEWFGYLFMLTLLAAAMSTLSGQFHAIGTSIGRDVYQQAIARGRHEQRTVPLAKLGILIAFVLTVLLAYNLGGSVIAIATGLFFGMSAAVFLPAYTAALFWPRATKAGAVSGMLVGLAVWGAWVLFFHEKESAALGLCLALFGKPSLAAGSMWRVVDPIILALPASSLTTVVASLIGRRAES